MQLLLERAVANLFQDIGVPRLVDFECFVAVGADDFMHFLHPVFVSSRPIDHLVKGACLANRARPIFHARVPMPR
jgi:hypothetical protein